MKRIFIRVFFQFNFMQFAYPGPSLFDLLPTVWNSPKYSFTWVKGLPLMARFIPLVFYLLIFGFTSCEKGPDADAIVIENAEFRLVIGRDARALSLLHKPSGQECLQKGVSTPVFSLTQFRPYDNENFLTYPAKPKTFDADTVYWVGEDLVVGFEREYHLATIGLKVTDDYIAFTLKEIDYVIDKIGVKRKTEIDEFTLLQLPVRDRGNFGEWLNVSWDNDLAVNILATDPYARIDAQAEKGYHLLQAGMETRVKLMNVGAALIATSTDSLLYRIDRVERDFNLPRGVQSRQSEAYKYSYYELRDVTPENIDENIAFARQGGFRAMVIYYPDFAESMGHFSWNSDYPNGMADLQEVTRKITEAGMISGFHIHYSKASKNDLYVTPVPDPRLNLERIFTLAGSIDAHSDRIPVEENPEGCTLEDERRILKLGNELVAYTGYTTTPPYQFTGCQRGELSTKNARFERGFKFGLLDVDTWPRFIRFDQYNSIQQEVAERLGKIYTEAGFRFVYFDGAEDVNPPYWHTVSKSQLTVYDCLHPEPLFSEGAIKSHFGWHILSRGNAFDIFAPELVKKGVQRYQAPAARYIAQDFTSINFGWVDYKAPGPATIGMQPDMFEYICSRGAAWDCPISLVANLGHLKNHPRTADNLEVIRRWEEARINNFFSDEQKSQLQNLDQEHTLLMNEKGDLELVSTEFISNAARGNQDIRAFTFTRDDKTWVTYWHCRDQAELVLPVSPGEMQLFEELDKEVPVQDFGGNAVVPVGKRRYLAFSLSPEKVAEIVGCAEIRQ